MLGASYFIDSDRQQTAELEAVLTPVANTLQSQQQGFLTEDCFINLVLHAPPAQGNAHQLARGNPLQPWSKQQGRQGQQAVPVAPHPIARLGAVLNHHHQMKHVDSRHVLRFGGFGVLAWGFLGRENQSCLGAPWALQSFFDVSRGP